MFSLDSLVIIGSVLLVILLITVVVVSIRISNRRWNSYANSTEYKTWRDVEDIKSAARDARSEMNTVLGNKWRDDFEDE